MSKLDNNQSQLCFISDDITKNSATQNIHTNIVRTPVFLWNLIFATVFQHSVNSILKLWNHHKSTSLTSLHHTTVTTVIQAWSCIVLFYLSFHWLLNTDKGFADKRHTRCRQEWVRYSLFHWLSCFNLFCIFCVNSENEENKQCITTTTLCYGIRAKLFNAVQLKEVRSTRTVSPNVCLDVAKRWIAFKQIQYYELYIIHCISYIIQKTWYAQWCLQSVWHDVWQTISSSVDLVQWFMVW